MAAKASFNPRSREGSDRGRASRTASIGSFNPRSREGSDLHGSASPTARARAVSIHAPVKGATEIEQAVLNASPGFNPRSREGSDQAPKTR